MAKCCPPLLFNIAKTHTLSNTPHIIIIIIIMQRA